MKLTIKHVGNRAYQVREKNLGLVELSNGETYEGEFDDGEAKAIAANKDMFKVSGYVEPDATKSDKVGEARIAELEQQVADLTTENAALREQVAKFDADGNGKTGGSASTNSQPVTLTDAVNSLDDKNDAHWTEGGKPDLKVLSGLTKTEVKRADVDAIARVRKTA